MKKIAPSLNRFGIKLFKTETTSAQSKNVVISPFSVGMALGMTHNGAANKTLTAMKKTLELDGLNTQEINVGFQNLAKDQAEKNAGVTVALANSIWVQNGFELNPELVSTAKDFYLSEIRNLNFSEASAKDTINQWASEKTQGTIRTILDEPISPSTVMFLINAFYFKGKWLHPFDKAKTVDGVFKLEDGQKKTVKMMSLQEREPELRHLADGDLDLVVLPYKDSDIDLILLVPRGQKKVKDVLSSFSEKQWASWVDSTMSKKATLSLPRLDIGFEKDLKGSLSTMGMKEAFTLSADFSRLAKPKKNLYIAQVKHKTQLKLDEEGTEAAATTTVVMTKSIPMKEDRFTLVVDRPFAFALYRKDIGLFLFLGQVMDPPSI